MIHRRNVEILLQEEEYSLIHALANFEKLSIIPNVRFVHFTTLLPFDS